MKELEQRIMKNGIDYVLIGDYYYPDLKLTKDGETHYGKYDCMRLDYINEYKKCLYSPLRMKGRLIPHLNEIDDTANEQMEMLVRQMMQYQGIIEDIKSGDLIGWLRAVNNIHSAAVICNEFIHQ